MRVLGCGTQEPARSESLTRAWTAVCDVPFEGDRNGDEAHDERRAVNPFGSLSDSRRHLAQVFSPSGPSLATACFGLELMRFRDGKIAERGEDAIAPRIKRRDIFHSGN